MRATVTSTLPRWTSRVRTPSPAQDFEGLGAVAALNEGIGAHEGGMRGSTVAEGECNPVWVGVAICRKVESDLSERAHGRAPILGREVLASRTPGHRDRCRSTARGPPLPRRRPGLQRRRPASLTRVTRRQWPRLTSLRRPQLGGQKIPKGAGIGAWRPRNDRASQHAQIQFLRGSETKWPSPYSRPCRSGGTQRPSNPSRQARSWSVASRQVHEPTNAQADAWRRAVGRARGARAFLGLEASPSRVSRRARMERRGHDRRRACREPRF